MNNNPASVISKGIKATFSISETSGDTVSHRQVDNSGNTNDYSRCDFLY